MKLTIKDFESYSTNPSRMQDDDMRHVTSVKKGDVRQLIDTDTGEEIVMQEMDKSNRFLVDKKEFRKVFVDGLPTISNLNSAGLKLLCYILANLAVKRDDIDINMEDCMEYTGYKSRANIYSGLVNLLENHIIYRKVKNGYYININIMYNGNRM